MEGSAHEDPDRGSITRFDHEVALTRFDHEVALRGSDHDVELVAERAERGDARLDPVVVVAQADLEVRL